MVGITALVKVTVVANPAPVINPRIAAYFIEFIPIKFLRMRIANEATNEWNYVIDTWFFQLSGITKPIAFSHFFQK